MIKNILIPTLLIAIFISTNKNVWASEGLHLGSSFTLYKCLENPGDELPSEDDCESTTFAPQVVKIDLVPGLDLFFGEYSFKPVDVLDGFEYEIKFYVTYWPNHELYGLDVQLFTFAPGADISDRAMISIFFKTPHEMNHSRIYGSLIKRGNYLYSGVLDLFPSIE